MPELLKKFLQLPELSTVGKPQERAAFVAFRVHRRTVREVGREIGVSKSNVRNLADTFQEKLRKKMMEIRKKGEANWSLEYRLLHEELSELLPDDYDCEPGGLSREDWAEVRNVASLNFDED